MGRDCGSDLPTFQILKPEYFSKKNFLCTKLRIELNIYELRHFAQKNKKKQTVLCRKVGNQFGYQFALRIFSISWDYEIQFKTHNKTLRLGRSGVAFIYF